MYIDNISNLIDKEFYVVSAGHIYDNIIEHIERIIITKALKRLYGNQAAAAKLLGLNRNTLHSKVKKYNINVGIFKK